MVITMSYIVRQRIRGKLYAYEATGEWDPSLRNSRQKRKYIGRIDDNGDIIPKGSPIPVKIDGAYDFGDLYLVLHMAGDLGLDSILEQTFHSSGRKMLLLAANRIISPGSMNLVDSWLSRTYVDERINGRRISELLLNAESGRMEFETRWLLSSQREEAIYFDITSLESYSSLNKFLEYGYSRSNSNEPQVNLGIVMGKSMRPLFYDVYPGSIPDVKTLINILFILERYGITSVTLVLDRGFYSLYNIRAMMEFNFIIPLPFSTRAAKNILKTCRKHKADAARMHEGKLIYTDSGEFDLDDVKLRYIHYYDPERENLERRKFFEELTTVESEISNTKDVTGVDDIAGQFRKYISIGNGLKIRRKNRAIARRLSTMGRMILISNKDMEWDSSLDLYRSRDRIEKCFRDMKSDLGTLPMGVHGDETMQGYLLIQFVSLIIESEIRKRMRESPLRGKMGMHEMLIELSKLRVVKMGSNRHLTEISKKQREIFQSVGIDEKNLVIK